MSLAPSPGRPGREDLAEVPASSYNYLTAVDDINAPDLYIPLMAAITYTLLVGFFTVPHRRAETERGGGGGAELGWWTRGEADPGDSWGSRRRPTDSEFCVRPIFIFQ